MNYGAFVWLLFLTALFVGVIVAIVLIVIRLFRMPRRRNTPGWWAAAWITTITMFIPFVGITVGLIVLQIDRSTARAR